MRYLLLLVLATLALAADPDPAPARKAAEAWLPLIDSAQYDQSWDQAGRNFRAAVPREKWAEAAAQVRKPLGKFKLRTFALSQFMKDPPNAPPGDYYLLQYNSDFENKAGATETVVLMNEEKNVWKLAGYFIK
jgi:hypothetical protein